MDFSSDITNILTMAKVVQLTVAPVFFITGIASLLGVLLNRLARITDRARDIERKASISENEELVTRLRKELKSLSRRARLINISFSLSVLSAFLVCVVVMLLFFSSIGSLNLSQAIAISFILAMLLLILALLCLLLEVYVAIGSMRNGMLFAHIDNDP